MCIQASHPQIETVTLEFLNSGKQFTAFDVTKEVRIRVGRSVNIRHDDVKAYIHGNFQDLNGAIPTSYSRQVIHLPNGHEPFLYFPVNTDPSDYVNAVGGSLHVSSQSQAAAQASDGVPSVDDGTQLNSDPDDDDEEAIKVTKENRVNIPMDVLKGVTPANGSYDIEIDGNIRFAKVNADGRVRVTVSYREGDKVSITPDKTRNCVIISKCAD